MRLIVVFVDIKHSFQNVSSGDGLSFTFHSQVMDFPSPGYGR